MTKSWTTAPTSTWNLHFKLRERSPRTGLAGLLAAGLIAGSASGQILETYGRTLTAYSGDNAAQVADLWPRDLNRGVNLDGTMRMGAAQPWAFAGNPFGEGWDSKNRLQDVRLDTGTFSPTDIDIALPAPGFRWVIGRSFNGRQFDGVSDYTSNGPQGQNWMQLSQAEIVFSAGASGADDVVYIVYGADRYLEFQRTGSMSEIFKGKNGAAGLIKHTAGDIHNVLNATDDEPEIYEYYDQNGTITTFFGQIATVNQAWQIWKITDPSGNVAYVGDSSNPVTARSGYATNGRISTAYDSADRRYTYTYSVSTIGGTKRLTQVKAETKASGTWANPSGVATVGQVDYDYYTANATDIGLTGDLKMVTITTPLTDSGVNLVQRKYYRYYTQAYVNQDGERGEPHQIKMVLGFEGCRNKDWADGGGLDGSFTSVTAGNELADLKPYAEAYLEYYAANDANNPLKVKSVYLNGLGGCGACGTGTYTLDYAVSSSCVSNRGNTSYDTGWATRTVVGQPDGTYFTQYFDETGQPLSHVLTDAVPTSYTKLWATHAVRNSAGQLTAIHSPAQISTGYTHDSGGSPSGTFTTSGSTGLVTKFNRVSGGNMDGFPEATLHQEGTGTAYFDAWTSYTGRDASVSSVTLTRPFIEKRRAYYAETSTYSTSNTYDETTVLVTGSSSWWSSTSTDMLYLVPKKLVSSEPAVSTGKNGSNSATTTERYVRQDGTTAFSKAQDGILSYAKMADGLVTVRIEDVNTTSADVAAGDDYNGVFGETEVNIGIHRKTTLAYDPQGRSDTTTMPDGHVAKTYYSKIGDGRMATISLPAFSSSTTVWYGPASYTVSNHAGKSELRCTLAVAGGGINTATGGKALTDWITEATADPLDALLSDFTGTNRVNIHRLSTTFYNQPGTRMTESRAYVTMIPTSTWTGSAGTDYDATTYVYDDMGRQIRMVEPTATISRTAYDTPGRVYRRYIGTDDTGDTGSPLAGTNNMVKVEEIEYDGNVDHGNSYLTQRTLYVQNSTTDQRVTTYASDYRGRMLLQTNPVAPHTFNLFDTRGRMTATAQYSSTASISITADTPLSEASGRVAISETKFDERGQVYQTVRHKVDQSDGSDDDSLTTNLWYDPVGRRIKVRGNEYAKTRYDRLGRTIATFSLATDNDSTTYSHVYSAGQTDVAGDTVMEESLTWYEDSTNSVLVSASIMRHVTDSSTTGDLDTNADNDAAKFTAADISGRIQITANWYDDLHRVASTVNYGTNLIVGDAAADATHDFTRPGSAPSASTTKLRTDYAYDTAGNLQDVTDPRAKVTRTVYDVAGRKVATIGNYVNGTPSGVTGDDDVYTRYVYTAGLQTKMWVDFDGDGNEDSNDQVTTYTYGVTKGTSAPDSKISSNRLLLKVVYPEQVSMQAEADRRVSFAYNAQGQEFWHKDQATNEFETTFDTLGRVTIKKFTSINTGDGFDDAVKRIETAYLSRGLIDTVTQFDATSSGTTLDQVQYTYDDWGNLTKFEQDPDSAIGGGGRAAYSVQYTLSKSAPSAGRQTVRRDTIVLPGSLTLTYSYGAGSSTSDYLSRVAALKNGMTTYVSYDYTGAGWLVGTTLAEPSSYSKVYDGTTTGSYPNLDRFNRTTGSRWTKDLASDVDFYSVDIAYDEASNIVSTQDNIQRAGAGISANRAFDVVYAIDGLNRVTEADEGTQTAGTISNRTRKELWSLTQTGNFAVNQLDIDGNSSLADPGDIDDTRNHNNANEIVDWTPTGVTYTPSYDKTGNMTSDDAGYNLVYDVLGRLRKIKTTANALVAEYTYNGLGYRIGWHYDTRNASTTIPNGIVDSNDPWYYFCYDERWRSVATYRATDSAPKERFAYHAAGLDGRGGSSYIDTVILRDKDKSSNWALAADGTFEERLYYGQNWRADVVAMVDSSGSITQWTKYFAYGTPLGIPGGDTDSNGVTDSTDQSNVSGWATAYDVRADVNLSGAIDIADDVAMFNYVGQSGGWQALSGVVIDNRKGYAGYENGGDTTRFWHVRHRVLDSTLGRWTRRDPAGYVDGVNRVALLADNPLSARDPSGLLRCIGSSCGGSSIAIPTKLIMAGPPDDILPPDGGGSLPEPWDCAAWSTSYSQCYSCCNEPQRGGRARSSCYNYCNRRYRPPAGWPPFLPAPGHGGPCFRESAGHPACTRACTQFQGIDGQQTWWERPDGERVLVCCVCDVTNPPVAQCEEIGDCVTDRFKCFAFSDPSVPVPCRNVKCIIDQLECLHRKLNATSPSCRQQIINVIAYWEEQLRNERASCSSNNSTQ
jgi:RHS repeat-associated protein